MPGEHSAHDVRLTTNAPSDPPAEREILVALVDDNRISRDAHVKLINAEPGVRVISAEATLRVTMLSSEEPGVVLVQAGDDEVISLKAALTTRRVLPVATLEDLVDTVQAVADGAHVLPVELTSPLFVQSAAEGIEPDVETDGRPPERARVAVSRTVREQEIVALAREGLANRRSRRACSPPRVP